jgi:energy-coupling factor transport system substrate-specific component
MGPTSNLRFIGILAISVGLNLGIGLVVTATKAPVYLDSIGTLLATALGGLWVGILCGLISSIVGSVFTATLWAYTGTMLVIAVYTWLLLPFGYLKKLPPTAILGLGLGVVCSIISAPVTTYLWTGVSLSGTDSVTAFFMAKGWSVLASVILGNLSSDPIDKLVISLVAFALLRWIPVRFLGEQATQESTNM